MKEARAQIADELKEDLACIQAENERAMGQHRRLVLTKEASPQADLPPTWGNEGSPYRNATYDLAKNYTLFIALMRVQQRVSKSEASWVLTLIDRHGKNLLRPQGNNRGAADTAVADMLSASPAVTERGKLFDPAAITDDVFQTRLQCAEEWLSVIAMVREEHLELEREVLESEL